jgi:cyclic beta-1,2-glucan synthetase
VAADVYSEAPHVGRGGWTWYTGAAGWMYRAGIEGILGLRREGEGFFIEPRLPAAWPGFSAVLSVADTQYQIHVERLPPHLEASDTRLDGVQVASKSFRFPLDRKEHDVTITLR